MGTTFLNKVAPLSFVFIKMTLENGTKLKHSSSYKLVVSMIMVLEAC